ncbi:MAG: MarR family winged helix-turn-helix transcriptional regulator [Gammaproteobacteria bacterium]
MPQRLIPAIQRATHQIGNSLAAVKGLDVNPSEAHILAHLEFHGATSIDGLHKTLGMHHSTLTSVLKRLVGRRLITRKVNPEDRRSFVVNLTTKGHGLARRIVDALTAICATALSGVSTASRDELVRVLLRF